MNLFFLFKLSDSRAFHQYISKIMLVSRRVHKSDVAGIFKHTISFSLSLFRVFLSARRN